MKNLRAGEQRGGQKGTRAALRQVTDPDDGRSFPSAYSCGAGLRRHRVGRHAVRCLICPSRNRSSSPNIVRMIADAPPVARDAARPDGVTRPFSIG